MPIPARAAELLLSAVLASGLLSACPLDAQTPDPPPGVQVRDSAGIRIITSDRPAWGEDRRWTVDPVPLVSIGRADGAPETLLHRVRGGARLPDGGIAIANSGTGEVRVYGPDGQHMRTVGRPGQGPGEFTQPWNVYPDGDTLVVWDNTAFRVSWFDAGGDLQRSVAVERPTAARFGAPSVAVGSWLLPDLDVLAELRVLGAGDEGSRRPTHHALRLRRSTDEEQVWDTLATFPGTERVRVSTGAGTTIEHAPPHARRTSITFGGVPSRVCIGEQVTMEIRCWEADRTETLIRWSAPRVPVTSAEIEAWKARWLADRVDREGTDPATARDLLDRLPIPEHRPPYGPLVVDETGHLWAEIPEPLDASNAGGAGTTRHQVFDPEGRWLGEVALPRMRILEIGSDHVLGVQSDELGVERVRVFRLRR